MYWLYENDLFELMLRNNAIIDESVLVYYTERLSSYNENSYYSDFSALIKELESKLSILQQYARKQKIEKIISSRKGKN